MGQSKQLLNIDQQTLLSKAVETALATNVKNIAVVLGANIDQHKKVVQQYPIHIVLNPLWEHGIGSSIKAGTRYMIDTIPSLKRLMIMVCDQPLLTTQHLKALLSKHDGSKSAIAASEYGGTLGTPVLFSNKHFSHILSLADDEGAKKILHAFKEDITAIPFKDGAIDLDTPDDYLAFINRNST